MKYFLLFFNLIVIHFPLNAQSNDITKPFNEFTNLFHDKSTPLNLDRKTIFGLATYNTKEYKEISSIYQGYLLSELLKDSTNCKFRCIINLKYSSELILLLIAKDIYENGDQIELELYLDLYKQDGEIIDYKYISGFKIDTKEKFAEIEKDLKVTTKEYQFSISKEQKHPDLYYAQETIENWAVTITGLFVKTREIITNGYFNGDWGGYKLIYKE
ncbi:MAG: hypothetical protein WCK92_12310 [Bacteroidota bacterium]